MISTQTHTTDILIIGAGLAGLLAATDLQASGFHPLIVDKGRGVGGRLASRRIGSTTFDHGAQFITARTPRLAALLSEWQRLGLVTEWYRGTNAEHIHWRPVHDGGSEAPVKILECKTRNEDDCFETRGVALAGNL